MKKGKKLAALVLMAILTFTCVTAAFAANTYAAEKSAGKTGWVEKSGKKYYYKDGKLVKDKLGYKIGKKYYKIRKKGVAVRVSEAEGLAGIRLEKIGRKLSKAFQYSSTQIAYWPNCGSPKKGQKEADYYAVYGFKYGRGDCYVMACTFYQMAKVLGYDAHYVKGGVPQKNGKIGAHGWVEIDSKGKTRVYDPNFAYTYRNSNVSHHSGYCFKYGTKGTYQYKNRKRVN